MWPHARPPHPSPSLFTGGIGDTGLVTGRIGDTGLLTHGIGDAGLLTGGISDAFHTRENAAACNRENAATGRKRSTIMPATSEYERNMLARVARNRLTMRTLVQMTFIKRPTPNGRLDV